VGLKFPYCRQSLCKDCFQTLNYDDDGREVRCLGGGLISIKGPVTLTVEICSSVLKHPFYYYEGNATFLMGFDLITAAAEKRCVWSKFTPDSEVCQHFAESSTALTFWHEWLYCLRG